MTRTGAASVTVVDQGRIGKWFPGEHGEPGAFHGPLSIVIPAVRAVRDGSAVRVGFAQLRADAHTPAGAMAALHAGTNGHAELTTGPEVCMHLLGWAYMRRPGCETHLHHG